MGTDDWKTEVRNHFENMRILEKSQGEAVVHFEQFCEFVVEPAFESLAEEFLQYGVKAKYQRVSSRDIRLAINFPGKKIEQYQYRIVLPKNAVETRMILTTKGRKKPASEYQVKEEGFMPSLGPEEVLKVTKEDVILDVLEHYKNFAYEALTSPD
jgi:hypothetical protein